MSRPESPFCLQRPEQHTDAELIVSIRLRKSMRHASAATERLPLPEQTLSLLIGSLRMEMQLRKLLS